MCEPNDDMLCLVIVSFNNQFETLSESQRTNLENSTSLDGVDMEEEETDSNIKQSRAVLPAYLTLTPEAASQRVILTDYSLGQYKLPTAQCKVISVVVLLSVALQSR
jgi:hypothetical protein